MAFLFKSKKNQDRALSSRDGSGGGGGGGVGQQVLQGGPVGTAGRVVNSRADEKGGSRSTPTGSLNSIDNPDGSTPSPDQQFAGRRGPTNGDAVGASDIAVSLG